MQSNIEIEAKVLLTKDQYENLLKQIIILIPPIEF